MATKRPTRRRQQFVIEPLNWVAPDVADDESDKSSKSSKQTSSDDDKQD